MKRRFSDEVAIVTGGDAFREQQEHGYHRAFRGRATLEAMHPQADDAA